ncbi:OLC1v1023370C1 [Oldenlandia corymbosa var. corymbosa]|uniref:OLC1v1023370C1 n=1 Tax=Oldenlandia corymbosa var. corymbosa TaxID=529605 RepID=A0AAV1BZV0_OLDCO|nr:OLC1v1023370C1 [Oldenlandia corymbosa var. corymbosa]
MEVIYFKPIAAVGFVAFSIYWVYKVVDLYWFRPKKLEKCLREQGFKGNPYRLFLGDQYESGKLIREALSKPIGIDDDVKKRIIPHVLKAIETHGKKSFMWVGRIPRVFMTDPELIREVLTKYYKFHKNHHDLDPITKFLLTGIGSLEGESWSQRRKTINPAFHFEKLKLMLPAFYMACNDMVNKWEAKVPNGGSAEVEAWHDIEILTGDVISRTLFGSNFEEGRRIFELMRELTALTIDVIRSVYIPGRRFLPTKRNRRLRAIDKEVRGRINVIIDKKMKAIKAGGAAGDDFLGILLECNMKESQEKGNNKSAVMSTEDIIGECKLFYFAGQDTTSTLLVWTMVFLSRYPEWQQRARDEVLQVFGHKKPDYDGISRLKIVTMILNEVLRIYAPVAELTKVAHEDTQLGKYFIPAGVQLMMPQMLMHHDTEIWGDDAMKFNPERFSEGVLKATKSQGSYFPFSLGPRMCIGMNFAFLEAKMAMALILRRFSFKLSPSYVHAPMTLITLQPQFGAHLILQKL